MCCGGFFSCSWFLEFTTTKEVTIKDWRLALLLRFLQACVIVCTGAFIIADTTYQPREIPDGYALTSLTTLSLQERSDIIQRQYHAVESKNLTYCHQPELYDYSTEDTSYGNYTCQFVHPLSLFASRESHAFVTTSIREETTHYFSRTPTSACPKGTDLGDNYTLSVEADDACVYSEVKSYFPVAPEDLEIDIMPGYSTSKKINQVGTRPATHILPGLPSQEAISFDAGEPWKWTMKKLLSVAGIDLDQNPVGQDNATRPYPRLSGVTLVIRLHFYSAEICPYNAYQDYAASNIVCVALVNAEHMWSPLTSDLQHLQAPFELVVTPNFKRSPKDFGVNHTVSYKNIQRHGIHIRFISSGEILGSVGVKSVMDSFVWYAVWMHIALTIVTYVALYCMGNLSKLYDAAITETVHWREEYAKYASHAIVAGYVFSQIDRDNSHALDRAEVHAALTHILRGRDDMEEWKIAAMVDFIMKYGDKDQQKTFFSSKPPEENFLTIDEWVDIFTDQRYDFESLETLVGKDYRGQSKKRSVMDLLRQSQERHSQSIASSGHGASVIEYAIPVAPVADLDANRSDSSATQPLLEGRKTGKGSV